jgi:hypothetical protein
MKKPINSCRKIALQQTIYNNKPFYMYLIDMKKLLVLFALLCIVSLGFNSCKPDDDYEAKDWPIPQEVLDYYFYKKGTFWVFENDKTGEKDTLRVENANKYWIDGSRGDKFEQGDIYIKSSLEGYTYRYYVNTQGSAGCIRGGSKNPCYNIKCAKYKTGDVLGESFVMYLPFEKGLIANGDFSSLSSKLTHIELSDSIDFNSQIFRLVIKINITHSLVANRKDMNFYWAKGKGLIQKENLTDNQTWKLIDYTLSL